ncbi:MAG: hypothetical protein EOS04_35695 [Mesorhizobium sp.]|nr:MAG: hypothetical protein EOS02_27505 [Mesorhizobium sp.]RWN78605.1 MAG: hypothetical protein EOS04_35695 [Mesorhizobium sp.]
MKYTKTGPSYWTKDVDDPHGLLAKSKLSVLMQHDTEASRRDRILWDFHLGWSNAEYEHTSLASVRLIHEVLTDRSPTGKSPLSQRHINEGNRALCKRGYITEIDKGAGRNASRFSINWDLLTEASEGRFPPSVSPEVNANGLNLSVSPEVHASVSPEVHANTIPVSPEGYEDLFTSTRLKTGLEVNGNEVSAAADAPAAVAPGAAAGFDKCWCSYGKYGSKVASKAAWANIQNPDVDHIAERAASWCASAKPGQKRMPFEKWLAEERYDEADRKIPTVVKMPRRRPGATRRDAEIEDVEFDGRLYRVTVKWNDARKDEKKEYILTMSTDAFGQMLRDLDVTCANDILYRRVLADFHIAADGTETDKWYRYPDAANDNLSREGESEDEAGDRNLHWKDAA